MKRRLITLLMLMLVVVLAGCASRPDPAETIQSYLEALVSKDRSRFIQLICPAFEGEAMTEFDSFGAVDAELEGVVCERTGSQGDYALVRCQGEIAIVYEGEPGQQLSLEGSVYRALQVDNEWKMCGYG
jgi:hypothetical protein